jgi:hypothetical protein
MSLEIAEGFEILTHTHTHTHTNIYTYMNKTVIYTFTVTKQYKCTKVWNVDRLWFYNSKASWELNSLQLKILQNTFECDWCLFHYQRHCLVYLSYLVMLSDANIM